MLAIVANTFDRPSETFIRAHAAHIAPGRTVLICREDGGAAQIGCPVLSDVTSLPRSSHLSERIANGLRFRWWTYIDPAARGRDEARIRAFLYRHGVKAVLAEYGPNGSMMRVACRRAGVPLYVHFHGFDATKLARDRNWRRHYRALFRDAAGILAPSNFLASRIRQLGCSEGKLHITPNGIDTSSFSETTRKPGRILAVGRLVEKKAPHLTIRAFAKVRERYPDCQMNIVGDGALFSRCVDEINQHCLADSVHLHGARSHDFVCALYSQAALFVQHSVTASDGDTESFGISLIEAMASSVPIVTTDHNGFSDTVEHGETGLLVAEHDVEGMAEAMVALLSDPDRAERMGRAGRARVEAHFTQERTAARLREIMGLEC